MAHFRLPDLGEGIPEADIVEWHISVGDQVHEDQIIVSVETAKAVVEVPSPQDGCITRLCGKVGDTIRTGALLVEFAGDNEDEGTVVGQIEEATDDDGEDAFFIGAAPSTQDYVNAVSSPEKVDGPSWLQDAEKLQGPKKQMARSMASAGKSVVLVTLFADADIQHWPDGEDLMVRLMLALVSASEREPALNSWYDHNSLSQKKFSHVDLGVAVDTEEGLFVPVIRGAECRTAVDLRQELNRLRAGAVERVLAPDELSNATITLSNFGTISGRYATPVVVPPTVCILGSGAVTQDVVAVNQQPEVHKILPLSLSFDHRAVTGGEAARFLDKVIKQLEK